MHTSLRGEKQLLDLGGKELVPVWILCNDDSYVHYSCVKFTDTPDPKHLKKMKTSDFIWLGGEVVRYAPYDK